MTAVEEYRDADWGVASFVELQDAADAAIDEETARADKAEAVAHGIADTARRRLEALKKAEAALTEANTKYVAAVNCSQDERDERLRAEAERLNDIMVRHGADAIIPFNEEQAEAFKAFGELVQSVQSLEAENERLDRLLRQACRCWAMCCDSSVMYPPLIRNAGNGLAWLKEHDAEVKS